MKNIFLIKYEDKGYLNGHCVETVSVDENDRLVVFTKSNLCVYVAEDYRDGFLNNLQAIDENRSDIQNEMRC
tara:strand:- start:500 stop:715 length:216 start_codon:yes stop_codon:yes gene_type:complete